MATATDVQRIDVADIDEVWAKVNAMLAASPEFKAFPQGGPAEEWAIHDYEGFGGWKISEYENLEKVLMVANLIGNKGDAFATWVGNDESVLDGDYDEVEEAFDEAFAGEFDSMKDFAEDIVEQCGWAGMAGEQLEQISSYLDYDKIGRNLEQDYWHENGYVFRSS